jgi:hypothetical protein
MKSLGCRRFGRLLNEASDRVMTTRESAFLDRHRARCGACRMEEEAANASLNLLRGAIFEADVAPSFDHRVVRRAQVALVRDSFRYWSPAVLGGAVAAGLILAAIQAFTRPIAPGATPGIAARPGVAPSLAFDTRQLHLGPSRSAQ